MISRRAILISAALCVAVLTLDRCTPLFGATPMPLHDTPASLITELKQAEDAYRAGNDFYAADLLHRAQEAMATARSPVAAAVAAPPKSIKRNYGLTVITAKQTALVADEAGTISFYMPAKERNLSDTELLLVAVCLRMKDEAWKQDTMSTLTKAEREI